MHVRGVPFLLILKLTFYKEKTPHGGTHRKDVVYASHTARAQKVVSDALLQRVL